MSAEAAPQTPVIPPSRLGRYLERKLNADRHLQYLGVQGEVSNLRVQPNGNTYFSLKDRDAVVNCVAFAESAATFPAFDNGEEVIAYGAVRVYMRNSSYQLNAVKLERAGLGALYAKIEELSRKLEREGLFADARKRPLPRFPFRVALVGSPSGDGTRDFVTQARERAPHVELRFFDTPVNGAAAAPEIARAIARADADGADVLVVVRGGGSFEDLVGFSDERVVRALGACRTPTVAAIGHERDQPLIELIADQRASTPSKAAQTVLPKREDLRALLRDGRANVERALALRLERLRRALDRIEHRSPLAAPARLLEARRQSVDRSNEQLALALERALARRRTALARLERELGARTPHAQVARRRARLETLREALVRNGAGLVATRRVKLVARASALDAAAARVVERKRARFALDEATLTARNPEAILERGYAIVYAEGHIVTDPAAIAAGTPVEARVARGTLYARVERESTDGGEQITLF